MSAITQTARTGFRGIYTSARAPEFAVCMLGSVALAFAFPKAGWSWLAPLGAAGLFWAWERLSWRAAIAAGWIAGAIYFCISYSWFTYTVGSYVGPFAFAIVVIPAGVHALTFAATALCTKAAARRSPPWLVPLAGAAAFTVFEWLRSIGVVGIPFAQIGYSQSTTALSVFAAYAGSYGITFVVMLLGASVAYAIVRRSARLLGVTTAIVAIAWALCYLYWPARHAPPPFMRVAAVQGNVKQSLKTTQPPEISEQRYEALTLKLQAFHPQLIVWPETVILTDLNNEPGYWNWALATPAQRRELQSMLRSDAALQIRLSHLAAIMHATLSVGAFDRHFGDEGLREYNALYTFDPRGRLVDVYDKRQLVPFAESLPSPAIFSHLPYASLIGRLGHGSVNSVVAADGLRFAPLICWESAFSDVVHAQIERGAQFLVIPTDDAWFGPSSGTYQHAQIAQMRAIETGEWVVQAAATGISGIIAPNGTWQEGLGIGREGDVAGVIGRPAGSLFDRIGPYPIAYAMIGIYVLVLASGLFRGARA